MYGVRGGVCCLGFLRYNHRERVFMEEEIISWLARRDCSIISQSVTVGRVLIHSHCLAAIGLALMQERI
jgi:hypothetical protein